MVSSGFGIVARGGTFQYLTAVSEWVCEHFRIYDGKLQ